MNKPEIRKLYLQKRMALTTHEYIRLSQSICDRFFSILDLSQIKVIHTFLPIDKNKEPNTWLIIDRIKKEFPNIKLSIPRINNQTGDLENFYFENHDQLKQNILGIPEPKQGLPTESKDIDLVLVPLLAFDDTGHRVGYGKGFYDKFLQTCHDKCRKAGLSFFEPVSSIGDVNPHDKKLDLAITPDKNYVF
jgi:5-formyltetrahydrofolate cyclo-ligase